MERIIIDTDPGVDDAHAIMMAFAHPNVQVEALTAVAGNVGLDRTVPNACTILDELGVDAPVYAGCAQPLVPLDDLTTTVHGRDGLGDSGFPLSPRPVESRHAVHYLIEAANAEPGELTLIALGPLTNLAVALKLDPDLPSKYKNLVIMGGAINARGNMGNLTAEFNVFFDPEAAHVVFEGWPEFTLAAWEPTVAHRVRGEDLDRWLAMDTPRARFFKAITGQALAINTQRYGYPALNRADPLAMAVLLEPDIVRAAETHHISVELSGHHTRGQTTVDWADRSGRPANANIVLEVDHGRFVELMESALL